MRIGVYGSAAENNKPSANEKAREIGREIARKGHVLITGGCNGFPYEAVIGAREFDGHCIAYSPATSLEEHVHTFGFPVDGFSEFVYTPESFEHANDRYICLKYRNLISVASVDAGLIIGGRTGTMNEFTLLYDWGKNIGVLAESGGITNEAIQTLLKDIDKDRGSKIIYDAEPISLVKRLVT